MMSRCFTWFPIGGLGEPYIYHNLVYDARGGRLRKVVWLWRISGGSHRRWWAWKEYLFSNSPTLSLFFYFEM